MIAFKYMQTFKCCTRHRNLIQNIVNFPFSIFQMDSTTLIEKPHAVCIPFPAQGHINPMLKLAKVLHQNGFHITFVNTEFNHSRLLKSRGAGMLEGLPSFQFKTIPDGLPPSDANATQDVLALCESTTTNCLPFFKDLLAKLNDTSSSNVPPVSCIVSDGVMSFTLEAAQKLGIPQVFLWSSGACSLLGVVQYPKLIEKGIIPLKDADYLTNGYLDQVLDWIPGMKGIRLRDLPTFARTTNPDDYLVKYLIQETDRMRKASAIVLNTFEELEGDALDSLSSVYPPIYPIGPLQFLQHDESLRSLQANLWKEETECLEWLASKESNSVVYVNFGSITVMSPEQLVEFAWGLANSQQTFLWIIRPDLVSGDSAILPQKLMNETKERGLLAGWCPQEKVLKHPSVGGFLTHNGWNSTFESISSGVPMVCWPFFADQQTNCWYCCRKWGIGMEIDSDVKRDEVEGLVREMMVGEKGLEMTKKVIEWKNKAEEATRNDGGSSRKNLEKLIHHVLLSGGHK